MIFLKKTHCNQFYIRQSFFNKKEVNEILSLKSESKQSTINLENEGQIIEKKIRASYTSWINIENIPFIYNKLNYLIDEVNNTHWRFQINHLAESSIVSYLDKKDNYGWHMDWSSDLSNCNRKLSVIVQLSDQNDYEGCQLQIKISKYHTYNFVKEIGSVIVFPSFLLHRATKLISGERHVLVLWYHGDAFL